MDQYQLHGTAKSDIQSTAQIVVMKLKTISNQ